MKLCVYFGTFNPIHNAHLEVARYIRENYNFDTILFVPAYKPPHKEIDDELAHHRLNMLKLAIEGEEKFVISNIEFRHNKFSYSINTIKELYNLFPVEGKINFIIGTDAFKTVEYWHNSEEFIKLVKFIVFPREDDFDPQVLDRFKTYGYDFSCAELNFNDISSTKIRKGILKGRNVAKYLPEKVMNYITTNGLYVDEDKI